jgi:hypothetical protein
MNGSATAVGRNLSSAWNFLVSRSLTAGDSVEERMAHTDIHAFRAERTSRSADSSLESDDGVYPSDDGFDYPPTAYPGRELFTASVFVLLIIALVVWGGWKLFSLI